MTARQFLALQSAKSTAEKFRKHEALYAANPGFGEQVSRFHGHLARVTRLAREQAVTSEGLAAANVKARERLIDLLVVVTGIGEGWAASAGQENLRLRLTTTRSELMGLGLRIEVYAYNFLKAAKEAQLLGAERFGMTEELLGELSAQIDLVSAAQTVRGVRDERKTVTKELNDAIVEMMGFLQDVLDPLMRGYLLTETRFCEEYRNSRRIGGRRSDAGTDVEQATESVEELAGARPEADRDTSVEMESQGLVIDEDAEADAALEAVLGDKGNGASVPRATQPAPSNGAELAS